MKYSILLLVIFSSQLSQSLQTQAGDWPLESIQDTLIVRGTANISTGAVGQCFVLDGESLIELKESADLTSNSFSVSLWFNPYDLTGGQQMLAGKNRYSKNERQWSLTIEPDGKLKAHLQQGGWSTITCDQPLAAGRWHQAILVVATDKASLYLDGKPAGDVKLKMPIVATQAPITLGGIWDANAVRVKPSTAPWTNSRCSHAC